MTFISSLEGRGGGRGGGCSGGESPAVLRAQCCIPSLSSDLWLKYRDFTSAGKKCLQQRKRRKTGKISKTASAQLSRELRLWKTQLCFHHLQLRCAALCVCTDKYSDTCTHGKHTRDACGLTALQHLCGSVQQWKQSYHSAWKNCQNSLPETEIKWN